MGHPERWELATESKFCEMKRSEMQQNQGASRGLRRRDLLTSFVVLPRESNICPCKPIGHRFEIPLGSPPSWFWVGSGLPPQNFDALRLLRMTHRTIVNIIFIHKKPRSHPERWELATESKFCEMERSEMERNQGANLFATQGSINGFCCAAVGKVTFP